MTNGSCTQYAQYATAVGYLVRRLERDAPQLAEVLARGDVPAGAIKPAAG